MPTFGSHPLGIYRLCQRVTFSTTRLKVSTNSRSYTATLSDPVLGGQAGSPDPFSYSGGRWLYQDEKQQALRRIRFDFDLLCRKAIEACPGATNVLRYEKKEGGFNRVFIFQMDNAQSVIARLPFAIAGPRRLTTQSEVATMAFVSSRSSIPVPKVIAWSYDKDNPVGTEYIIMEHVRGSQLHQIWPDMNPHQHMLVTKAVAQTVVDLARLSFSAYGSLYFADADVGDAEKIDIGNGFVIGPHCGREYWLTFEDLPRQYLTQSEDAGPWSTLKAYTEGLLASGLHRLPPDGYRDRHALPYRGEKAEHLRLLGLVQQTTDCLVEHDPLKEVSAPMLLHPDLHKRNIYVSSEDPTIVTAIIDWQSASVDPTFVYAGETPDLATPPLSLSLIPEMDDALAEQFDRPEGHERLEKDYWTCRQTFEVMLKAYVPQLARARTMNETLFRPFRYSYSSWRDGAVVLRQELIELAQAWTALGLSGEPPYQPSAEELEQHTQQMEDFETLQKFKLFLVRSLDSNSEGWVSSESYASARELYESLFRQWMEQVKESEDPAMNVDRGRKLWPWSSSIDTLGEGHHKTESQEGKSEGET